MPLELVLPAFPAKPLSKSKGLGKLPDAAESIALQILIELVCDLEALHAPGVSLVICSDYRKARRRPSGRRNDRNSYAAATPSTPCAGLRLGEVLVAVL